MFNPKILVSPVTAMLQSLRLGDNNLYNLLLTKQNAEVVGTKPNVGEYNTLAVINDLDDAGNVINAGRVITYNQLDLGVVVNTKAEVITNIHEEEVYHLLSHSVTKSNRSPTTTDIATTLTRDYAVTINDDDIELTQALPETIPMGTPGVPVNPVEPPLPGSPINPEEPVDPTEPDYTPRLINCTLYDTLYTYTGGSVAVSHRNILPKTPKAVPSLMELGLQIIRPIQYSETLDLILPVVEGFDDWTFLFETTTDSKYIKAGVIWFKLHYNYSNGAWQLHMPKLDVVEFDALNENTLTIEVNDNIIRVSGTGADGEYISVESDDSTVLPEIGMHRITVYADNPNPRTLQFKLNSSEDFPVIGQDQQTFRGMSIAESSKVYANVKSNALFGQTSKPVVITDVKTGEYVEDEINTYVSKKTGVKYSSASVTKLIQTKRTTQTVIDCTIANLNELCLSGALSSIIIHLVSDNDVEKHNTVKYDITNVSTSSGTMTITSTQNSEVSEVINDLSELPFTTIITEVTPVNISIETDVTHYISINDNTVTNGINKYRVKYTLIFNTPTELPSMMFEKITSLYMPA